MKKEYRLEGLDCENCADKIERNVAKIKGVHSVLVTFASKKMEVEMSEDVEDQILNKIKSIEPDVQVSVDGHNKHTHVCEGEHEHNHGDVCAVEKHAIHTIEGNHLKSLYLEGLDCASCAAKIEREVKNFDEVQDASLSFTSGKLDISFKEIVDNQTLGKIKNRIVYLEPDVKIKDEKQSLTHKKIKMFDWRKHLPMLLGTIIYVIAMLLEESLFQRVLFLIAYLSIGYKVLLSSIRNIKNGEIFDENFLMSVATIGAFVIGEYFEAVAVMLFYEVGELVQSFTVERSRVSIGELMDLKVESSTLLINGVEQVVLSDTIQVGDIVVVKPGERIGLDGRVIDGSCSLDTSALTGESVPRRVKVGDQVLSGSLAIDGVIKIEVEKLASESTVARILDMVENASSKKAPFEKFITKFSRVYTPIVCLLALLIVLIPMLVVKDAVLYDWVYRGLTFLVVSCPCALVISVPLGLFAGIGGASRKGVLVKGGNYLEALDKVDTIVFDKTGTLTKGEFKVTEVHPKGIDKETLLEIMAYGEYYSNHPIAKSILQAYGKKVDETRLSSYEEIAGHGIVTLFDNKKLLIGNKKLMLSQQQTVEDMEGIGSVVYAVYDGNYIGNLMVGDEIKETSGIAIQELHQNGIHKIVMLSGDRKEAGQAVGKRLGIDEIYTELLPSDKVEQVEHLLRTSEGKLAFVGDGINDAPVLARADVGFAMGALGSDAAIEAADIVLMNDDPRSIVESKRVARKTMRILKQNVTFSLGIKALVLVLSSMGMANMWLGVFADIGVTILAILNSMRALYR